MHLPMYMLKVLQRGYTVFDSWKVSSQRVEQCFVTRLHRSNLLLISQVLEKLVRSVLESEHESVQIQKTAPASKYQPYTDPSVRTFNFHVHLCLNMLCFLKLMFTPMRLPRDHSATPQNACQIRFRFLLLSCPNNFSTIMLTSSKHIQAFW